MLKSTGQKRDFPSPAAYTNSSSGGVPEGLVNLARLFDVVMILCYEQTCIGQLGAWPASLQNRVCLADAHVLYDYYDPRLIQQWKYDNDHPRLVTLAYTQGLKHCGDQSLARPGRNLTYLVLEHDFQWVGAEYDHDSLAQFTDEGDWDVIRFGYCPRPFGVFLGLDGTEISKQMTLRAPDDVTCRSECLSEMIPNTNGSVVSMPGKGCEIFSSVGQALSSQAAQAIMDLGDELSDPKKRCKKYTIYGRTEWTCAIDVAFTTILQTPHIHYHNPPSSRIHRNYATATAS